MALSILKPPRLRSGDVIGLISPASPPSSAEKIQKSVAYFERLGYRVVVGKHASDQWGYLAGSDKDRADDFNSMVMDKSVNAIIAVRGGYGTPRILPLLDYPAVKRNPKIIVGYSDLTALQLALFRKCGIVTFSGPMAGVEFWNDPDPYTEEHFWRIVTSSAKIGPLPNPQQDPIKVLRSGKSTGHLLGGNLSLLISLLATPYAPLFDKSILFLEEVEEAPHRVDRMLTQLRNAGIFKVITGLLLGRFTNCVPTDPTKPFLSIDEVLADVVKHLGIPVIGNLQYGHVARKLTLPLGVKATIGTSGVLEGSEAAVV